MSHPLDGARAKIARAREHIARLEEEVGAYMKSRPIRVDTREERDGAKRHIQWIASAATEPPAGLGHTVGDWANNARAALDYTVYELVRRETGADDPRWTQFPIVVEEANYQGEERRRLRAVRLPVATRCPHSIEAVKRPSPRTMAAPPRREKQIDPEGATPLARTASGEKGLSARVTYALPSRPRSQTRPASPKGSVLPDDVLDHRPARPHAEARGRSHLGRRCRSVFW